MSTGPGRAPARAGGVPFVTPLFIRVGVLPFFLVLGLIIFASLSRQFLTVDNLVNVARQSVYLVLVSLGQMVVLITGGFDLSVGTVLALASVISAMVMVDLGPLMPDQVWLVIALGALAGLGAGLIVGLVNGIGVSIFGVSPFIMTLGVQSVGAGASLFLTGGVPVSGLPPEFADMFGFGRVMGVPVPVLVACLFGLAMWIFAARTRMGRYIQAVGGNIKAAELSGIDTRGTLLVAYGVCAMLAAVTGLLLTARVESGDANLGGSIALQSIAACVIGGVSLRGGIGRVENVVLGAFFIVLTQNGMNLLQIGSYMQMVLLGVLLILAVIADQVRYRLLLNAR
jgi:ribose transport system permease protein